MSLLVLTKVSMDYWETQEGWDENWLETRTVLEFVGRMLVESLWKFQACWKDLGFEGLKMMKRRSQSIS